MSTIHGDDIEAVVDLEQQFYNAGYADGLVHGRIHGLIEGRALGRQKGFEMWEELAFYEGFAKVWKVLGQKHGASDDRASRMNHNAEVLLELIARFPIVNPSTSDHAVEGLDIMKLMGQIRSRYKMLCISVGAQPSLRAGFDSGRTSSSHGRIQAGDDADETGQDNQLSSTRNPLWRLDHKPTQELSF